MNVVLGNDMADRLRAERVRDDAIQVVHNWADGDAIRPCGGPGSTRLRDAWGLTGKFVVAYSGNMGRAHEFATILDAAESLKDIESIALLFIGRGPRHGWIEAEVKRRALGNVTFQPYQPRSKLGDTLCAADAHFISLRPELEGLIVPSKFYGIASAGLPTLYVGDTEGEIGRLIRQAQCGLAVRPDESELLAAHIRELAADPEGARIMGANARILFEQQFDKPIAMAAWRELLDAVFQSDARRIASNC